MVIGGEGGDDHTGKYGMVANFGKIVEMHDKESFDGAKWSRLSLDYFRDMAGGLESVTVDDVMIAWGVELPI